MERFECFRLAVGPVEREHELGTKALVERMALDQYAEVADQ